MQIRSLSNHTVRHNRMVWAEEHDNMTKKGKKVIPGEEKKRDSSKGGHDHANKTEKRRGRHKGEGGEQREEK